MRPTPATPTPVSLRLDPSLHAQVEALAHALDRSKSWVIEQAVRDYVAQQDWQLAAIEEGVRAADAGKVIVQDEVEAWVATWDAPGERPPPRR